MHSLFDSSLHTAWLAAIVLARAAAAQASTPHPDSLAEPHLAPLTYGVIGSGGQLAVAGSMDAGSVLLQYTPVRWLAFSVEPTYLRVTQPLSTGGDVTNSGFGDLPLGVVATTTAEHWAGSPSFAAGLEVSLPTGDSAKGLGGVSTGVAGELGAGVSATSALYFYLSAWHPFSGFGVTSATPNGTTSVGAEGSYSMSERFAVIAGYTADLGHADSGTVLPASVVAGMQIGIAPPVLLTVNGAFGVNSGTAPWFLSIGIGTAFNPTSPLGPGSLISQVQSAVGRGKGAGRCHHFAC